MSTYVVKIQYPMPIIIPTRVHYLHLVSTEGNIFLRKQYGLSLLLVARLETGYDERFGIIKNNPKVSKSLSVPSEDPGVGVRSFKNKDVFYEPYT